MISSSQLRGEIKKQLDIRGWNYKDLARETGYSQMTIRTYMSDQEKQSERFETAVRKILKIQEV